MALIEEQKEQQKTLDKTVEGAYNEVGKESDSDTEGDEVAKNPKLDAAPEEDASEYSSESASRFIIMPVTKPSGKKTPSSKIFSDEDEIALLEGLAVFWADGRNNKWTEFHQFIKDDLPNPFTKIQVSEKIRMLKKKFETNCQRACANGGSLDFSDPHESLVFELSKRLWGDEKSIDQETKQGDNDLETNKISRKRKQHDKVPRKRERVMEIDNKIDKEEFELTYPFLYASFDILGYPKIIKDKCSLIGREKAEELEKKWRELRAEEHRLEVKKINLIKRHLQQDVQMQ